MTFCGYHADRLLSRKFGSDCDRVGARVVILRGSSGDSLAIERLRRNATAVGDVETS